MSHVKQFTIGSASYNAGRASAVNQDRMLSLLTQSIVERAMIAAKSGIELDQQVLTSMFMAMPTATKREIADILMHAVMLNGSERKVTIEDFDGQMVNYNRLLAELLRWNLSDFFDWLPSALKDEQGPKGSEAQ
tara:strand:+ start:450 stop:851 length:402 start_codon:yes stop_codon:yes gene_type:complete